VADDTNTSDACKKGVQGTRINILKIEAPNSIDLIGDYSFKYKRRNTLSAVVKVKVLPMCSG